MNRIILLICAVVGGLLCLLVTLALYRSSPRAILLSEPPAHGVSFVIECELTQSGVSTNGLDQLRESIRKRASKMGAKIFWEPIAESRLRVFVATDDTMSGEALGRALFSGGLLEFRLVHENSDELVHQGEVPAGYHLLERKEGLADGSTRTEQVVVKDSPEPGLAWNLIKQAVVSRDELGKPQIDFVMQPDAASAFGTVTRENVGRQLAIILDGNLYSAPVIRSAIEAGRAQITGHFDMPEAFRLAAALEAPLPIPVKVVESKSY